MKHEKKLRDLEKKARNLISEIVPIVKMVPLNTFSGLNEFLDNALEDARASLNVTRQETERRIKIDPSFVHDTRFRQPLL